MEKMPKSSAPISASKAPAKISSAPKLSSSRPTASRSAKSYGTPAARSISSQSTAPPQSPSSEAPEISQTPVIDSEPTDQSSLSAESLRPELEDQDSVTDNVMQAYQESPGGTSSKNLPSTQNPELKVLDESKDDIDEEQATKVATGLLQTEAQKIERLESNLRTKDCELELLHKLKSSKKRGTQASKKRLSKKRQSPGAASKNSRHPDKRALKQKNAERNLEKKKRGLETLKTRHQKKKEKLAQNKAHQKSAEEGTAQHSPLTQAGRKETQALSLGLTPKKLEATRSKLLKEVKSQAFQDKIRDKAASTRAESVEQELKPLVNLKPELGQESKDEALRQFSDNEAKRVESLTSNLDSSNAQTSRSSRRNLLRIREALPSQDGPCVDPVNRALNTVEKKSADSLKKKLQALECAHPETESDLANNLGIDLEQTRTQLQEQTLVGGNSGQSSKGALRLLNRAQKRAKALSNSDTWDSLSQNLGLSDQRGSQLGHQSGSNSLNGLSQENSAPDKHEGEDELVTRKLLQRAERSGDTQDHHQARRVRGLVEKAS